MVSGLIAGGFTIGSFIFGFIAQALINPDNAITSVEDPNNPKLKYFDHDVADNFPSALRILCAIYISVMLIAQFLITLP